MHSLIRAFLDAVALVFAAHAVRAAEPVAPVQVMVLGTYHFANPGRDVNNMRAESVLTSKRRAELAEVARAVAAWKPTHAMVEMEAPAAKAAGQTAVLAANGTELRAFAARFEAMQETATIGELLALGNEPAVRAAGRSRAGGLRFRARILADTNRPLSLDFSARRPGDKRRPYTPEAKGDWYEPFRRERAGVCQRRGGAVSGAGQGGGSGEIILRASRER